MCDRLEKRRRRFIRKARECHGDWYDYSQVVFTDDKYLKVTIICPEHGPFQQCYVTHLQPKKGGGHGYMGCRQCGIDARPRKQLCIECGAWNKYGSTKFCKECSAKRKESRKLKTVMKHLCKECGKPTGSRDRIYCSSECRTAKSRIAVECCYCKKQVIKYPSKVQRAKKSFCGPECQRLAMIGNGDPNYASRKAKEAWVKEYSRTRMRGSTQAKWWRRCNVDMQPSKETDPWQRRCATAISSLSRRASPVNKYVKPQEQINWEYAGFIWLGKLKAREKWAMMDQWKKKCGNTLSNIAKRRRKRDERSSCKKEGDQQATYEVDTKPRVQMRFEWD